MENRITEQVTWMGWTLKENGMPKLATVGGFFVDRSESRTTRGDVLNERAFKKLRGYHLVRFVMMGFARIDTCEFAEINTFLRMAEDVKLLPERSRLRQSAVERDPVEPGLDGRPLAYASVTQVLQDQYAVTKVPRPAGKNREVDFVCLHADLVTLDGLDAFRTQFNLNAL